MVNRLPTDKIDATDTGNRLKDQKEYSYTPSTLQSRAGGFHVMQSDEQSICHSVQTPTFSVLCATLGP